MGVKNGLKDVGRVLDIDFNTMNDLTKQIDIITDEAPSIKFKDLDDLINGTENEKKKYEQFKDLENKYLEVFRLARAFEGTPRNMGVHASGVLITPYPINNIFPTRIDEDGSLVTIFTGPQVENLGGVKVDVLGLKTLDVLDYTIKAIDKNDSVYKLYERVNNHLDDENLYTMLNNKETEGIFQLESHLFKSAISNIPQSNIEDITVLTSIERPGPLGAGLDKSFANRKNGTEEIVEPLPGTWEIVKDSLGVLVYQEHTMRIAQIVAGFDDNQADSYLRKAQAKKKRSLMELCDQWFIYGKINQEPPENYSYDNHRQPYYDPTGKYGAEIIGGINNGYDEQELIDYTIKIKDFCSYLFNKSHASTYSFLSVCTMYLKYYHKVEFFAALLSMQTKQEKIDLYCKTANDYGIEICIPNINLSNSIFTALQNKILYGLNSIKGIGAAAIPEIINNRPYNNIEEAYKILGTKIFNKRVGEALIKAGAFEFINSNRNELLNEFQIIRKAKKEEAYSINYNKEICIEYEREILGSPITYKPYWQTVLQEEVVTVELTIIHVREKIDRNGNMMAFLEANIDGETIKGIIFSKLYCNNIEKFDLTNNEQVIINAQIKKDDKNNFVVNKILKELPVSKKPKRIVNKKSSNNFDKLLEIAIG